jgi:hypothetical protein
MELVRKILMISMLSIAVAAIIVWVVIYAFDPFNIWPRPDKVERAMIRQIVHSHSSPGSIRIQIKNVTSFRWETMYAFQSSASKKEIEEIIGTHVPEDCEISPQLFFLKNSRIVYQECEPSDFEGVTEDEIYFDIPEGAKYKSYLPNAVFSATIEDGKEGSYYVLKQIQ